MSDRAAGPTIRVVHGDALATRADVLALKWAQAPYGVDRAVLAELGRAGVDLDPSLLPGPGGHLRVGGTSPSSGPSHYLFLGVPVLRDFRYIEIRDFARRILPVVARELPDTRRLTITLHGPGNGLDELAAFEAELHGLMDGIAGREVPDGLREIVFVERNRGRARRLEEHLARFVGDASGDRYPVVTPDLAESIGAARREPGRSVADRPTAFVAIPFTEEFEDTSPCGSMYEVSDI